MPDSLDELIPEAALSDPEGWAAGGVPDAATVEDPVDPLAGVLTLYRRHDGAFAAPEIRRAEGDVALHALPDITLNLDFMAALRTQLDD